MADQPHRAPRRHPKATAPDPDAVRRRLCTKAEYQLWQKALDGAPTAESVGSRSPVRSRGSPARSPARERAGAEAAGARTKKRGKPESKLESVPGSAREAPEAGAGPRIARCESRSWSPARVAPAAPQAPRTPKPQSRLETGDKCRSEERLGRRFSESYAHQAQALELRDIDPVQQHRRDKSKTAAGTPCSAVTSRSSGKGRQTCKARSSSPAREVTAAPQAPRAPKIQSGLEVVRPLSSAAVRVSDPDLYGAPSPVQPMSCGNVPGLGTPCSAPGPRARPFSSLKTISQLRQPSDVAAGTPCSVAATAKTSGESRQRPSTGNPGAHFPTMQARAVERKLCTSYEYGLWEKALRREGARTNRDGSFARSTEESPRIARVSSGGAHVRVVRKHTPVDQTVVDKVESWLAHPQRSSPHKQKHVLDVKKAWGVQEVPPDVPVMRAIHLVAWVVLWTLGVAFWLVSSSPTSRGALFNV